MRPHLSVLYEDNHLLAVNKPAGLLVQGDVTGDKPLVDFAKDYLASRYNKPGAVFLGVVHRLDRPVSGVVMFARTSKSLERMNALFRNRETKKTYLAVVEGCPELEEAVLVHWLTKDEKKNKASAFKRETPNALRSELSYKIVERSAAKTLLEVHPITGRPHQIRVQLAAIGCPVFGDLKYGSTAAADDAGIGLHALRLEFIHPVKKELMVVEAPTPRTSVWESFPLSSRA